MSILFSLSIFVVLGGGFVLAGLTFGRLVRPRMPGPEKGAAYECGEPAMGPNWVQFDLRFYIVALLYLVFDVEVALFYPWAVVYGDADNLARRWGLSLLQLRSAALLDMVIFFGLLVLGFAYLWRFGYLDWVKVQPTASKDAISDSSSPETMPAATSTPVALSA